VVLVERPGPNVDESTDHYEIKREQCMRRGCALRGRNLYPETVLGLGGACKLAVGTVMGAVVSAGHVFASRDRSRVGR
jgi:hypothetical protein